MAENSSFHQSLAGRDTIFRGWLISFSMSCWKGMWRGQLVLDLPSQRGPIRVCKYTLINQSPICIVFSFQLIFLSLQLSVPLQVPIYVTKCNNIIAACITLSELWNSISQGEWAVSLHKGWQVEQRNILWFHTSCDPASSDAALVFSGLYCVITRIICAGIEETQRRHKA